MCPRKSQKNFSTLDPKLWENSPINFPKEAVFLGVVSDAAPQSVFSDDFKLQHGHFKRIKRASNLKAERSRVAHRKEDEILRRSRGGLFSKIF